MVKDFSGPYFDLYLSSIPSTVQNVCVESYVLGINMCTCRNTRQGELRNTCKPDIHCALLAQWTCVKKTRERLAMGEKTSVFAHFVRISIILFS